MLRALILSLALLALPASAAGSPEGGAAMAFVAAENDSELVAVDLTTLQVVERIRVPRGPHNVAAGLGLRYVLVTSPPAGAVTLVDAFTRRVLKVFRGFGSPHDVEAEGRFAYVTDEARGRLVVIGIRSRRVVASVAVGPRPHDVAVGDVAVVTHGPRYPFLTLVDVRRPAHPRVIRRIRSPLAPHDISEQPDSARVFLSYWSSGEVGAVDWGTRRHLFRRRVGHLVHHVQLDFYDPALLWATDHHSGEAFLLSSRDGRVLRRLKGCPGAHHIALSGTARAVVACHDGDSIAIFDRRSWRRAVVPVGDGPHGVAVAVVP